MTNPDNYTTAQDKSRRLHCSTKQIQTTTLQLKTIQTTTLRHKTNPDDYTAVQDKSRRLHYSSTDLQADEHITELHVRIRLQDCATDLQYETIPQNYTTILQSYTGLQQKITPQNHTTKLHHRTPPQYNNNTHTWSAVSGYIS